MKLRFTAPQLQAIANLRTNSDFKEFMNGLGDQGESMMKSLIYATEREHVIQGRLQFLTELLDAIQDAPAEVERLKQPQT